MVDVGSSMLHRNCARQHKWGTEIRMYFGVVVCCTYGGAMPDAVVQYNKGADG